MWARLLYQKKKKTPTRQSLDRPQPFLGAENLVPPRNGPSSGGIHGLLPWWRSRCPPPPSHPILSPLWSQLAGSKPRRCGGQRETDRENSGGRRENASVVSGVSARTNMLLLFFSLTRVCLDMNVPRLLCGSPSLSKASFIRLWAPQEVPLGPNLALLRVVISPAIY